LRVFEIEEVAKNISGFLRSQLDLREEGRNLTRFAEIFKTGPCAAEVAFPAPLAAKETVLVETFETGVVLSKLLSIDHDKSLNLALRKQMAQVGVRSFLEMVIVQNFCHADAHPGNIMIRTNPPFDFSKPDYDYQFEKLVYVDAGLVNQLSQKDQVNFVDLFAAVADGDGERAANLMIDRSRDPSACVDREAFVRGMSSIIDQVQLDSFRLDRVRIGTVLEKVMTLVHRHHVRLEPNFSSLVVSIIVLEGVGRQLDPELDIFRTSVPMLLRAEKMYKKAAFSAVYDAVTHTRRNSRRGA
jgi:aarF domain-containing kinase